MAHALVFGATGGIGRALCERLAASRHDLIAVSRSGEAVAGAEGLAADFANPDSLDAMSASLRGREVDLAIIATGILSDGQNLQPEKSWRHLEQHAMRRVFDVNTVGPALAAKAILPHMPRKGRAVLAALSARVGSIEDNGLGGWHSYRASKAALNMIWRNIAIEQRRRNPDFIALSLHPGTVDTGLSKPFQGNVPDKQLFSPDRSAGHLLEVINGAKPEQSGMLVDWAGKTVPF